MRDPTEIRADIAKVKAERKSVKQQDGKHSAYYQELSDELECLADELEFSLLHWGT